MTVTLKLRPGLEAGLLPRAEARGMSVEQYLLFVVEGALREETPDTKSAEQHAAAFEAWANSHSPSDHLLSDYAVSRESIYEDLD
ncbi:MAG: hypothetical protein WA817_01160 [Candidatus Acidiferrum sp.]